MTIENYKKAKAKILKTNTNKILVHLNLNEGFNEEINEALDDELNVASKKWGVRLNMNDRALILKHARNQLRRKVSESAKIAWNYDQKLSIRVSSHKRTSDINLPTSSPAATKIRLIKSREGWEIEQEPTEESVAVSDFLEHFKSLIITWGRTAVFYGVSSYAS